MSATRTATALTLLLSLAGAARAQGSDPAADDATAPPTDTADTADPAADDAADDAATPAEAAPADAAPADAAPADAAPADAAPADATAAPADDAAAPPAGEPGELEPVGFGLQAPEVELHGFVSQGFIKSIGNNYLARSRRGSFEFSEAALNASVSATDTLSLGMQFFARDLGPIGDYKLQLDWFHLDWRPRDVFGLRAGRVRMPFGLYNAVSDYDPGRVSILLPESLYSARTRDFLLALTGVEAYGHLGLSSLGYLEYRAFAGTLFIDSEDPSVEIDIPYATGGRLLWEPPVEGLRVGGSLLALRLQGTVQEAEYRLPAVLWVVSSEYQRGRLLLAAEYGRWHTEIESSDEMVIESSDTVSERFYLLSAVELTRSVRVGAYYSGAFEDVDARRDPSRYQHDVAATLRYDINPFWIVKIEPHYMRGHSAATDDVNRRDPGDRRKNWAVLLVKTTAYF